MLMLEIGILVVIIKERRVSFICVRNYIVIASCPDFYNFCERFISLSYKQEQTDYDTNVFVTLIFFLVNKKSNFL